MTRVVTANLDFAKSRKQHRQYLAHLMLVADIILNQEAKRISLRRMLPGTWNTMQRLSTAARRGSAISWRRPLSHRKARLRVGALPVARVKGKPKVAAMRTRWIALLDVRINNRLTTVISVHWPPLRYSWLWPQMDRNVVRVIVDAVKAGHEVLLGADFNAHPAKVVARLNALLKPHGIVLTAYGDERIDGFLVTKGLIVEHLEVDHFGANNRLTDHPAVIITVSAK